MPSPVRFLLIVQHRRDAQWGKATAFVHLTQFTACRSPSFVGEGDVHAQRLALPYLRCGGGVASEEIFIGQMPPLSVSGMRF